MFQDGGEEEEAEEEIEEPSEMDEEKLNRELDEYDNEDMLNEGQESESLDEDENEEGGFDKPIGEEAEGKQIMFGDFYKKGEEEFKGHRNILEGEEDVDEDEIFDKEREFLNQDKFKEIEKLENQMADEKSWVLKGEVSAKSRPMNSLLAEHLDFDVGSKLPEKVTKEATNKLENLIKQ